MLFRSTFAPPQATVGEVLVLARDSRVVDDDPAFMLGVGEEATNEVVLVPPGHDPQDAATGLDAGARNGLIPRPHVVASLLGEGFAGVLVGVVDY